MTNIARKALSQTSPSKDVTQFRLNVRGSAGNFTIPESGSITLNGTESRVLVTDFSIGQSGKKFAYSTAEILSVASFEDRQVVVLWEPTGQNGEILLSGAAKVDVKKGKIDQQASKQNGTVVSFTVDKEPTVIEFDNGVQVVIVNRETAYGFWAPNLESDPMAWENKTSKSLALFKMIRQV